MKSLLRYATLALVLVTVALVSALTAMRFAIHGREVAVPQLTGLTLGEAEHSVSGLGLQIEAERQYYSPNVPEGKIMSQLPLAGTKVRRGWQVRVAQSLGPMRISIPDVTGESERAAEFNIKRRGLEIESTANIGMTAIPPDQVVAQNPSANDKQVLAPKISLLLTQPADPQTYVMPSFIGQPLGTASRSLQDSGFKLGNVGMLPAQPAPDANAAGGQPSTPAVPSAAAPAEAPQPSPASIIAWQSPAPGQKVIAGTAVNFQVR